MHERGYCDGYFETVKPAHSGRAGGTGRTTSSPWTTPAKTVHGKVCSMVAGKPGQMKGKKVSRPLTSGAT